MRNTSYVLTTCFLAMAMFMAGCKDQNDAHAVLVTKTSDTALAFILHTDTVSRMVSMPAELKPYLRTDLSAKVQGYIREMRVDIGSRVHAGQVLATIEAPEVNTQVAQAEASLSAAKARYTASRDKYERLLRVSRHPSPGVVAPVDLLAAQSQMQSDSAACQALARQVSMYAEVSGYLYLKAPFTGIVTARHADPGALVASNTVVLSIQDDEKLRLQVAVPDAYVNEDKSIRDIQFSTDDFPEKQFTARLARKSGTIDPSTRTELWEFDVPNEDHLLKAGSFLTIKLNMSRNHEGFVVPASAIATTLERKFIIRADKGHAAWVDIRQGMSTAKGIEVFGDVHVGDTLLLKASDERKAGTDLHLRINK